MPAPRLSLHQVNAHAAQALRLLGRFCAVALLGGLTTFACQGEEQRAPEGGRVSSPVSPRGVVVRSVQSRAPASYGAEDEFVRGARCGSAKSVLFIGNSYTFYHGMPKMLADIASSAGCPIEISWATNGGYQLSLHLVDETTLEAIRSRPWDVVVLQEQSQKPGFLPEEVRAESLPVVQALADEVQAVHPETHILLYSTWGRRDGDRANCAYNPEVCSFEGHTDALERGYSLFAEAIGAEVAPVGRAFRAVKEDASAALAFEDLYDPDGSHPSLFGSYLAASLFFEKITGATPEGLGYPSTLLAEEAAYLQQVAALTAAGIALSPPGGSVVTQEKVVAKCDRCGEDLDEADTHVVLFEGTCSDWYLRSDVAQVAFVDAELTCSKTGCRTPGIDTWGRDSAEAIPNGSYSVFVSVDVDHSGGPSLADVEACEDGAFQVGGGRPLTIRRFYPRATAT